MPLTTRSLTIEAGNAGRVDLIVRHLTGASRSQARGMVDQGCVTINNEKCHSAGTEVNPGDVVVIRYNPSQRYREQKKQWTDRTFGIVFEDDHLIVVDKSAGTLTVPTDDMESNTLVERVSIYLNFSRRGQKAWVVHRLDRDVSGLVVFGKNRAIANQLIQQFKLRKSVRGYTAIVAGVVADDKGTFRSDLLTGKNLAVYSTRPTSKSETAITHYRVLKRMKDSTLVDISLETGKRNQIRVQFADAGHPVLGDPRYGKGKSQHSRWIRKRIALHAHTLGLEHPVTGERIVFESPIPAAFQKFLNQGVKWN